MQTSKRELTDAEKVDAMKRIIEGVKVSQALEAKTNAEIAQLLRDHFLNDMVPLSAQYELIEAACQRLDSDYYKDED